MNQLGFQININYRLKDDYEIAYFNANGGCDVFNLSHLSEWYAKQLHKVIADDIFYIESLKEGLCDIAEYLFENTKRPDSLINHDEHELADIAIEAIKAYINNHKDEVKDKFEEIRIKLKWDKQVSVFIEQRNLSSDIPPSFL